MKTTKTIIALAASLGLLLGSGAALAADTSTTTAPSVMDSGAMSNWFGGPIYRGAPALTVTAALVKTGGGATDFKFATALVSMLGEKTVNGEVAKLTKQYGKTAVDNFINGMTFDINDGLKIATAAGITLPTAPADLKGVKLAETLVSAGTDKDGTFWAGLLFDKAVSHDIHVQIMADVDTKFDHDADQNTHKILNQAMYDVAQALGHKDVKLAPLH